MDELKRWALMLCSAILACGIISILFPRGNCEKIGKSALSLVLLSCLSIPLNEVRKDITLQWETTESASQSWQAELLYGADKLTYSLAEDHILKLIQARLEQLGLDVLYLDVEFTESKTGIMPNMHMDLKKKDKVKESELRELLFHEYGLQDVEINWREVE